MCGINGIIRSDERPVYQNELEKMNNRMVHRGPDDFGYYINKNLGLAMRRLSIIDIKGGHQPIFNENSRYCVICNGEIYNYLELRKDLECDGHVFKTKSDVEVIVHLYEALGEGCLEKLNGMYAFAVWDQKERRLFLAVDRLGIKQLYYTRTDKLFSFSSELKSLMTLDIDPGIDREALMLYLSLLYVPYPRSMIKGISKMEPASYIKIDNKGNFVKKRYWSADRIPIDHGIKKKKLREMFLAKLQDAVRLQLRSDVPVGTFLSGGIDSSLVVAMISMLGKRDCLSTFSVGYEGHYIDERPFAKRIAEEFNTRHLELFLRPHEVTDNLERIAYFMDEPIGDSAAIPTFMLSEMARDSGVKVILNGTGGDEIFGGYNRYRYKGMNGLLRLKGIPAANLIYSLLDKPLHVKTALRMTDPLYCYMKRVSGSSFKHLRTYLKSEDSFSSALDLMDACMREDFVSLGHLDQIDRFMKFDLKTYLVGDLLFLLDKMTMASSIEGRVPLIDHRMAEFFSSIPVDIKLENKVLKNFVKEAIRGLLPDEIINRKKMGFGAPVSFWLKNSAIDKLALNDGRYSPEISEMFNIDKIQNAARNRPDIKDNKQFLYNLYVYELWYKNVYKKITGQK